MSDQIFLSLNLVELQIFLEHIRLGPDHVGKLLNKQQLNDVLELGSLTTEQQKDVESDKIEKTGNVALVLNTVITSTFGAWMGLSSCIGFDLGSTFIFTSVILLACLLSVAIGYNSYHVIHEQVATALKRQKFANLEIKILQRISVEMQKKSYKLGYKLYRKVKGGMIISNDLPIKGLLTEEEIHMWLKQFEAFKQSRLQEFSKSRIYNKIQEKWEMDFRKIVKILKTHVGLIHQLSEPAEQHQNGLNDRHKEWNGMELLIDPNLAVPKAAVVEASWLEKNSRILLVSLAPTLLGGFASMFVFIGGIPNIVQAFGFAHLYSARKAARRDGHLTRTKQAIINQETEMLAKNAHVKMLYKIKHILSCMFSLSPTCLLEARLVKRQPAKDSQ